MKKIIHISDLHFGKNDPQLTILLAEKINEINPDLIVVSGDLTQRASSEQFREAKKFFDKLPQKKIIVPGNHDIPLYNFYRRIKKPFHNFKKYIDSNLAPELINDEFAVFGINTARSWTFRKGKLPRERISDIALKLEKIPENVIKIIVTHHPFVPVPNFLRRDLVKRRKVFLKKTRDFLPDLILSGHLHKRHIGNISKTKTLSGKEIVVSLAGTTISTRVRQEANSYNLITIKNAKFNIKSEELLN